MPLIAIKDITVAYGAPLRPVLGAVGAGINLDIHQGDFICLLGQTGCGKSTMLRLVLGSERPATGQVLIDGVEHQRPDRTRGYVPQKYSLFPDRTVLDNITFGPLVSEFNLATRWTPGYFRRRSEVREEAMEYIRRIGLRESDAGKFPDQLSGGMQQRVAIAQALIMQPRILLMDEAFSALDPGTRREMQQLIKQLWADTGITVLFVTHNMQEAAFLASRVVVLAKKDPESGSQVALDVAPPARLGESAAAEFHARLEAACSGIREAEEMAA